jgi:pimeloyl-ACP methyl ester carboxylesterase
MKLKQFPFLNQAQKKMYLLNKILPYKAVQFFIEQIYNRKVDQIDRILTSDFNEFSPRDRVVMDDPELGPFLFNTFKHSVLRGPYGLLSDMRLFLEPWDFEVKDIKVPYYLYHGDADDVVHPIWSQFMKNELTDVRFKLFAGEGHYSLPYNYRDHFLRDIMSDLM